MNYLNDLARKQYLKQMRSVLTQLQRDWNGTLLPMVRLLEKTGEPDDARVAQHMRATQTRIIEAAASGNFEALEAAAEEIDRHWDELTPGAQDRINKAAAPMIEQYLKG